MKNIKPQKLGLLHKTYEDGGKSFFTVTLLVFFPLDAPSALLSEVSMWKFVPAELGKDAILDMCMPKSHGELLLSARAYPPGGTARPLCSVRAQLGSIDKTLQVTGDRRWRILHSSDPAPFTEMPITYANAFGGAGYKDNPIGKGHAPVRTEVGELHPLPNIEDPQHLVKSSRDSAPPAGFGPYDFTWPQRFAKAGTYDERWLKELYPGYAADMDWTIFNAAPEDQQITGFFRGDETFVLENLHPQQPLIAGALPGVATRCFINQKTAEGEVFREIATRLDTVWLFPHALRGLLVFRGVTPVAEDDAADVLQIVVGCEDLGNPKSVEHYQTVLTQRLDREKAHLYALRDSDLMPPRQTAPVASAESSDMAGISDREDLLKKNMRRRLELQHEKARQNLIAKGLNPDAHGMPPLPPEEPVPKDPEEIGAFIERAKAQMQQQKAELAAKRAATELALRKECEKHGVDYASEATRGKMGGPPRFVAEQQLAQLRNLAQLARDRGEPDAKLEATLVDPGLATRLRAMEQKLRETYMQQAHRFPAADPLVGEPAARLRQAVKTAYEKRESFAGRDLTGADLSNLDLKGADFRGALMESVNLCGSDLGQADLAGAVLARADLSAADLSGARLAGTNFGMAKLQDARLDGADLTRAVLYQADLSRASLRGAQLDHADLMEATLLATDFRDAKAAGLLFLKSDLASIKATGADFTKSIFLETQVADADFSGATLTSAVFLSARGDRANFRNATLTNLRVVKESSFAGADFSGAQMQRANLRGTNLAGSDFSRTLLQGADLSECKLKGAKFYRARAREAYFIRADLTDATMISVDLMQAILQKATLSGADLRGANLFRADLAKAKGDERTNFQEANLTQARVVTEHADAKR